MGDDGVMVILIKIIPSVMLILAILKKLHAYIWILWTGYPFLTKKYSFEPSFSVRSWISTTNLSRKDFTYCRYNFTQPNGGRVSNIQQIYSYSEGSLKYHNGFSEQEYFGYFLLMLDLPANT